MGSPSTSISVRRWLVLGELCHEIPEALRQVVEVVSDVVERGLDAPNSTRQSQEVVVWDIVVPRWWLLVGLVLVLGGVPAVARLAPCPSAAPSAPVVLGTVVLLLLVSSTPVGVIVLLASCGDMRRVQLLGGEHPIVPTCNSKSLCKRKKLLLHLAMAHKSKLESTEATVRPINS